MFAFYLDLWPCRQTVCVTVFREERMNKWFYFDSTETARCMFASVANSCTCRIHYLFPFASLLPWLPEVGNRRWINHLYRFKLNMLMSFPILTPFCLSTSSTSSSTSLLFLIEQKCLLPLQPPSVVVITCQTCDRPELSSRSGAYMKRELKVWLSEDRRPLVGAEDSRLALMSPHFNYPCSPVRLVAALIFKDADIERY